MCVHDLINKAERVVSEELSKLEIKLQREGLTLSEVEIHFIKDRSPKHKKVVATEATISVQSNCIGTTTVYE